MLQIQGDALIGQAKRCLATARNRKRPPNTRSRALVESQRFLDDAERTLRLAMSLTPTPSLAAQIESNLEFLRQLRDKARGNKS
jgi:hypothetical protein